ncbi:TPA: restriction endonuclease subunit S [Vibrio parahaemolyticus]|uniref:restriction endonuclease subunit S n=1 Tax=Vibrio parahaemolyticus TaxID=670 RepID=UPI0020BEB7D6|nr:restriction endonuclease subunit S [Vibrio parahaemolyticus]
MVREGMNIPHHWECKTLVECTSNKNISYGIVQPGQHDDNGIGIIRVNNFESGGLNTSDVLKVSPSIEAKFAKTRLNGGEVLLTLVGSTGQSAVVPSELKGWNVPRAVAVIRPSEDVSAEWINICLQSAHTKHFLDARANTTVQKTLNLKDVKDIPIPLPPVAERQRLEDIAVGLEKKITLNRQINQTLEQMAQTLFKSWFVDFDPVIDNALDAGNPIPDELQHRAEARKAVRESEGFKPLPEDVRQLFPDAFEESELGWVPKGWAYQSFGSLLASTIGGDWGKDVQDEKHTVQSRIVRGTDIPDLISGQLSSAPLRWVEPKKLKSRQIERGDIIIEVSGGSPKQPTGRSIFMTDSMLERLGCIIEPASFCRRFKPNSFNIGILASLHLQKIYAGGKTWEYQNQSTGIANFQTKFFLEAEMVLIPSDTVLEAFCRIVTPLVEKSQNNEQIALAKLRDTLLPKLISGELSLDDVEAAVVQETESA